MTNVAEVCVGVRFDYLFKITEFQEKTSATEIYTQDLRQGIKPPSR